jgi:hypothetical protein
MKKLVLSLLGAATLATASNAMALNTAAVYTVAITTGGLETQTFAGEAVFEFDSEFVNVGTGTPFVPPGSCVYSMQWFDTPLGNIPASPASPPLGAPGFTLTLSAQGFIAEQMSEGNGSCLLNSVRGVPSVVSLAPPDFYGPSTGFNGFGQLNIIDTLQLGETLFPVPALSGIAQFGGGIPIVYGITFTA